MAVFTMSGLKQCVVQRYTKEGRSSCPIVVPVSKCRNASSVRGSSGRGWLSPLRSRLGNRRAILGSVPTSSSVACTPRWSATRRSSPRASCSPAARSAQAFQGWRVSRRHWRARPHSHHHLSLTQSGWTSQ
jgi:hypothetical protein